MLLIVSVTLLAMTPFEADVRLPTHSEVPDTVVASKVDTAEVKLTEAIVRKLALAYPAIDTATQLVGLERPEALTSKMQIEQFIETIEESDAASKKVKEAGYTAAEYVKAMRALYDAWKIEASYTAMKDAGNRFGANFASSLDTQVRRKSDVWKQNLEFVRENGKLLATLKFPPPETGWEGFRQIR